MQRKEDEKIEKTKKVLGILESIFIFCITLVTASVVFFYSQGYRFYIVRSGSMEPAIKTGSIEVVNSRYPYEDIQKGDVVCFSIGDTLVTHRVTEIDEQGISTKGDANDISDGITVREGNYGGKELFSIPLLGYFASVLYGIKGRIIIAFSIVIIFVFSLFRDEETTKEKVGRGGK